MLKTSRLKLVIASVAVLLVLLSGNTVVQAQNVVSEKPLTEYIVKPGDSFWSIGFKLGIQAKDLAQSNNLSLEEPLQVGKKLQVPKNSIKTHSVRPGESLWSIAGEHGISVALLQRTNHVSNPDLLQIGQVLYLPDKGVNRGSNVFDSAPQVSFNWPLTGQLTSNYGWRRSEFHSGIDLAADRGTEIHASRSGTVVIAGWATGGYGLVVKIDHGDGYQTLYAHTSKVLVKVGDRVSAGDVIALVGSSGRSTGPHLHFEVRYAEKTINPMELLERTNVVAASDF